MDNRWVGRSALCRPGMLETMLLLGLLPLSLAAQSSVAERTLDKPDAEFAESFDQIVALRELPGGKVLVTDIGPKAVLLADFGSGQQANVGRNGQGPGEYQFPGDLLPYQGDSTLLVDRVGRRFLAIAPDGKVGRTMPFPDRLQGFPEARGTDRTGRIYFQASPFNLRDRDGDLDAAMPESTVVVRWDPGSGKVDTLARVKIPATKRNVSGGQGTRMVMMRPQPFASQDDWAVGSDGRVAVARSGDYHVDWVGDRPARGKAVSFQPIKVAEADKDAYMSNMKNNRNRMVVVNGPGRSGGAPQMPEPKAEEFDWPEYKPAFPARQAYVTPEGQFWLPRYTEARDSIPTYDVFDASGNLTGKVKLPKGRRVVGVGRGTVYAVRTDEDGLQWLERYRR